MTVVVNEFEVVPDRMQSPGGPAPSPSAEPAPASVASEVERTLQLLQDRALRLKAD